MARTRSSSKGRLEEALATLRRSQAAFLAQAAEIDARRVEMDRLNQECFARIEACCSRIDELLARIGAQLQEKTRLLLALLDAVWDLFGFQTPPADKGS